MGATHFGKIELLDIAPITTADAPTVSATPTQSEVQAVADLANAIKAKLNEICKG